MINVGYHRGRTQLSFFELFQYALNHPGSTSVMFCASKDRREEAWWRWKNTEWHVHGFVGLHDISKRTTRFENGATVRFECPSFRLGRSL